MADFKFEIVEHLLTLDTNDEGWTKELNLVSYNGANVKYDIRSWSPDHKRMGKGITLTEDEATKVSAVIADYYMTKAHPEFFEDCPELFEDVEPSTTNYIEEPYNEDECIITNIFERKPQARPVIKTTAQKHPVKKAEPKKSVIRSNINRTNKKKTAKITEFGDVELPF